LKANSNPAKSALHEDERELLRFTTCGSVDDGKSTLIGRLLVDSQGVYEDQIDAVRAYSSNGQKSGPLDFALLTDGLRAEREQGITIDVAYRYFSTPRRKFIIADTPGHEQYTRNMATGASTANLAVILLDAQHGMLPQSRRHAVIASMLGIRHIVVAVNKMDLMEWDEEIFDRIRSDFSSFMSQFRVDLYFIPISALHGDNVVHKSTNMPWYEGATLLHYLETVHVASDQNLTELRFPVQYVIRGEQGGRVYAGRVASGILKKNSRVMALPSRQVTRVKSLLALEGEMDSAFAPQSVTVCLEDQLDISRGDMLVEPEHLPNVDRQFDARLVWMSTQPFEPGREYLIKQTTNTSKARALRIRYRLRVESMEREPADKLMLNEIGAAVFESHKPLFVDAYGRNRATGSFILIDPLSNETAGAGMITGRQSSTEPSKLDEGMNTGPVTAAERAARFGHRAAVVWLQAPLEMAQAVERGLFDHGCQVIVVNMATEAAQLSDVLPALLNVGFIVLCADPIGNPELSQKARESIQAQHWIEVTASAMGAEQQTDKILEQLKTSAS
jgi:sulfate adenylyltransferase large subunit